jgi:hypothetical protein
MAYTRPRSGGEAEPSRYRCSHKISASDFGVLGADEDHDRIGTVPPVRLETIDATERRHFLDQRDGRFRRSGRRLVALRALPRLERAS